MTTKPYFCCNPTDDTVLFFDSAEEARQAALHGIEQATDGDWHQEVFGICWGRVLESAEVDVLHEHGSACVKASIGDGLCSAGVPAHVDFGGEVTLRPHPVPDDNPLKDRIAALEAEVARLRIRAEAREAQLKYAHKKLGRDSLTFDDVHTVLCQFREAGLISGGWWNHKGTTTEVVIAIAPENVHIADAYLLPLRLYPVGKPQSEPEGVSRCYSTDGTPPWEAP